MVTKVGVMICGHGSRDVNAVREFEAVARGIRQRLPAYDVESGFLEFATPIIRDGLDKLRDRNNDLVLAVPGMLFAAGHAKNDIPSVLGTYEAQHPEMEIRYGRELGIDPKLLEAAGDRIRHALDEAGDHVPLHETMGSMAATTWRCRSVTRTKWENNGDKSRGNDLRTWESRRQRRARVRSGCPRHTPAAARIRC